MKKTALQSMRVGVKKMAFLTRERFGTFEKRAPGLNWTVKVVFGNSSFVKEKKNENNEKKWKKKEAILRYLQLVLQKIRTSHGIEFKNHLKTLEKRINEPLN